MSFGHNLRVALIVVVVVVTQKLENPKIHCRAAVYGCVGCVGPPLDGATGPVRFICVIHLLFTFQLIAESFASAKITESCDARSLLFRVCAALRSN